jgi:CO/xanthine dehydrogenase Mo-binding subunit
LLEGKVLRSPFPHAVIDSIDTSKAEKLSGVAAVLTRADLEHVNPFYGNCLRDRPLVALEKARFVGEPIAVVAAETPLIAEEALSLIEVEYRELPCVATMDDALAGNLLLREGVVGAGEFHEVAGLGADRRPNVCHHERYEQGDVARGFAAADRIVEEIFEFPMVYQYAMEPHTCVARVTAAGITLWTSSKSSSLLSAAPTAANPISKSSR